MGESVLEYMLIIITASLSVNIFLVRCILTAVSCFFHMVSCTGGLLYHVSSIEERLAFVVDTCINVRKIRLNEGKCQINPRAM